MRQRSQIFALFLLVAVVAASQYAQAANLTVNCDKHESIRKALRLLATTNPQGPNTITVSGGCKANLVIRSMDRLTLITKKDASITDRSNGALAVVDIEDSQRVTLQGFTINGGAQGILCSTASLCYLTGNTIQGPGRFGVNVIKGSRAFLESNVMQDWGRGGGHSQVLLNSRLYPRPILLGWSATLHLKATMNGLPLIRPRPALTARIGDYIVRTARNRALPCATRS